MPSRLVLVVTLAAAAALAGCANQPMPGENPTPARSSPAVPPPTGSASGGGSGGVNTYGAATPDPDDWDAPSGEGAEAWAALRSLPEARHVGLALPRLLLRLPYGKETSPVDAFDFEELSTPPEHEEYLWGSPSLATTLLLGEAFLEDGWSLRPGSSQEISGLPFALVTEGGEKHAVPCAETLFTVRAMQAVTAKGLMPLLTMKGTDTVRLAAFQSISEGRPELAGLWS